MGLQKYGEKRNFKRTPEPPPRRGKQPGELIFVVQKHRARQLHYDFRLEVDGVLKSWSVPKGPSLNPADKRLAVMVEDHPREYASFEGSIPKGEYGGGEVIIWDNGTYTPDEGGTALFSDRDTAEAEMRRGLEKGKLSFTLRGSKLKGSWTLVKLQKTEKDWLLMKHRDEYVSLDRDILKEEQSAVTGRTLDDVKENRDHVNKRKPEIIPGKVPGARKTSMPNDTAPMLASLGKLPSPGTGWIFEPKLDGYRLLTRVNNGDVTLVSRNGNNLTAKYSQLVPELSRQPVKEAIFDGEIIALDDKGKQCFECLQNYMNSLRGDKEKLPALYPLLYYIFDILYLDGYDLRGAGLSSRKELLKRVFFPGEHVKLLDYYEKDGETVYDAAVKNGMEGVIAKRADSIYASAKRSDDWIKVKAVKSDEFLIGGYSVTEGGRTKTLSSLLLGQPDERGKLKFAGHVGSGFNEKNLVELKSRLDKIRGEKVPFTEIPELNGTTTWVKPELVAEVKFSEWTGDGRLRHPVFLRLREDKGPGELRVDSVPVPKGGQKGRDKMTDSVLAQFQNDTNDLTVNIEGDEIKLTNLNKVLWPPGAGHSGYTKRDLLVYLVKVAPFILPHLKDRPLTLNRYPDGINGEHFYQKHWGHPSPDFVKKIQILEEKGTSSEYMICNNLASLIWLGQVGDLEFHSWFSRVNPRPELAPGTKEDYLLDHPDFLIFDLDPYIYSGKEKRGDEPELNRRGFLKTCEVALWLKKITDDLKLKAYVKTSGKTGIHIYVPIKRRLNYAAVRAAAETIGKYLVQKHPEEVTTEWRQEKRAGKIFIDFGQNVRGKTLATIYSPRPSPDAAVSTPLRWEELGKVYPTDFTLVTLPERVKETGDLWEKILEEKRDLSDLKTL